MMALLKAPRSVFVDFPLGRQCGKPNDVALQTSILKNALEVLVEARVAGEIVDLPYKWAEPFDWERYQRDLAEMLKEEGQPMQEWGKNK